MKKPNILWICTDQQRADTLGCTGNPHVHTPNLDRFAAGSVLFRNAFCQNPLCQPSRGSFLTGRYPSTNRLTRNGQVCPPDLRIFPRDLKDHGYVNGLIGKLHLNACDNRLQLGPEWWRHPKTAWFSGIEPRIDDGYDVFLWDHAPSGDYTASAYTQWLHARTGGGLTESQPSPHSRFIQEGRPEELHQTTWCAEEAIRFIQMNSDRPQPWLLSLNIFDPHPSFNPPAKYLERYLDRIDDLPGINFVEGELDDKPAYQKAAHLKGAVGEMTLRDQQFVRAAYFAMVDLIDVQVGRILEALDASGAADNTIVIFMSDHGELLGDHGVLPKGPFLYDCSVRVPLMIRWPGQTRAGLQVEGLVELTDIVPTLREALKLPADPAAQGRSFWEVATGQADPAMVREDVFCEYPNSNPHDPAIHLHMIRTPTHKLVACHTGGDGELYDLQADPGENRNLWHDQECLPLRAELLSRLAARMAGAIDEQYPRIGVF